MYYVTSVCSLILGGFILLLLFFLPFESIKILENNNLEQKKPWLKQLWYFLDIDSLIGLESAFDRIPTR